MATCLQAVDLERLATSDAYQALTRAKDRLRRNRAGRNRSFERRVICSIRNTRSFFTSSDRQLDTRSGVNILPACANSPSSPITNGAYRRYAAVVAAGAGRSLAAIFTRSARESAFIFCITLPRCAFTVISLMPSSPPACLFNRPEATNNITCRSRCETGWLRVGDQRDFSHANRHSVPNLDASSHMHKRT